LMTPFWVLVLSLAANFWLTYQRSVRNLRAKKR
jgi:hypothetical protein